ncbi:Hypothetical protein, putative, partial [Bodo saltans]
MSLDALVAALPLVEWKPTFRAAVIVTAGDAATLTGATVKLVTCHTVPQLCHGVTTTHDDYNSPYDVNSLPMTRLYSLCDEGDNAIHLNDTKEALLQELEASIQDHAAAWGSKMKIQRNATFCPATVAGAALSMAKKRSQVEHEESTKVDAPNITDPSDVGFELLSPTTRKSDAPRYLQWTLFCAVVRDLLPSQDRVAITLLTTFLIRILSEDVTLLRLEVSEDEESEPDSHKLRRVGLNVRRRLSIRQQALQHCASYIASDLHDRCTLHTLPTALTPSRTPERPLQLRCPDSNVSTAQIWTTSRQRCSVSVQQQHLGVYVHPSSTTFAYHCQMGFRKGIAVDAFPPSLLTDPTAVRWPNDNELCCLHIEYLACDAILSFPAGTMPPHDNLHRWWDHYDKNVPERRSECDWFAITATKTSSRRLVVQIILWYLIEESLKTEIPVTASKYTTMPVQHILRYLEAHVVDVHSRIHQACGQLIKLIKMHKSHLAYTWSNPKDFGVQLTLETPETVQQYKAELKRLQDLAEAKIVDADPKRMNLEQLRNETCTSPECPRHPRFVSDYRFRPPDCYRCQSNSRQCEAIEAETTNSIHMPYASAVIASLCNPPPTLEASSKAAMRCLTLLSEDFRKLTHCNNSGQCVMQRGRWMQDLRTLANWNANIHIHCPLLKEKPKTIELRRVSDIFKIATDSIEAVAVQSLQRDNCYPMQCVAKQHTSVHLFTDAQLEISHVEWVEEHPRDCTSNEATTLLSTNNDATVRGNIAYTKNVSAACRRELKLQRRDTVAVLGTVRCFVETQHRMALQVILNDKRPRHCLRLQSCWEGSAAGRIAHSWVPEQRPHGVLSPTKRQRTDFIASTTMSKSCALVLIAQQYGMLFARDAHHDVGAAVLHATINKAGDLLEAVLAPAISNGNLPTQWEAVRRAATIVQAICAFIPHCWEDRFGEIPKAYLTALVFANVATLFIQKAPCTMCVRLEPLQTLARHGSTQWLPKSLCGHENEILLPLIQRLDSSASCSRAISHSTWSRAPASLLVYDGEVVFVDGRKSTYNLNLHNGEVFANNAPLTGLPRSITTANMFMKLFGKRNYLVHTVRSGWYRASADFALTILARVTLDESVSIDSTRNAVSRKLFFEFSLKQEIVLEEVVQFGGETSAATLRFRLHGIEPTKPIRNQKHFVWCFENVDPAVNIYRPAPSDENQSWLDSQDVSRITVVGVPLATANATAPNAVCYRSIPLLHQSAALCQLTASTYLESRTKIEPTPKSVEVLLAPFEDNTARITFLVDENRQSIFLEHFQTSFKVTDDGLVWADDVDYQLSEDQAVHWLPCCQQYLRLTLKSSDASQLKPKELVLLPLGFFENDRICKPTGFVVKASLHEHFGYIECDSFEGRILLATLLTFGSSGVLCDVGDFNFPTAHIEHITALLRRSFSNVPWTERERMLMEHLHKVNSNPSVHLLCAALEKYSMGADFLSHAATNEAEPQTVSGIFTNKNDISEMTSQYRVSLKSSSMHPCCVLEEDELRLAFTFSLDCGPPLNAFIGSNADWNISAATNAPRNINDCVRKCTDVYRKLSKLLTSDLTDDARMTWIPKSDELVSRGDVAKGIADNLLSSLTSSWDRSNRHHGQVSRHKLSLALHEVGGALHAVIQLKVKVLEALREFSDSLVIREESPEKTEHPHSDVLVRLLYVSHRIERLHQHHIPRIVAA